MRRKLDDVVVIGRSTTYDTEEKSSVNGERMRKNAMRRKNRSSKPGGVGRFYPYKLRMGVSRNISSKVRYDRIRASEPVVTLISMVNWYINRRVCLSAMSHRYGLVEAIEDMVLPSVRSKWMAFSGEYVCSQTIYNSCIETYRWQGSCAVVKDDMPGTSMRSVGEDGTSDPHRNAVGLWSGPGIAHDQR